MTSTTLAPSRALQLKASTADVHDNIDKSIMDKDPFANTENYIQFLTLLYMMWNHMVYYSNMRGK